MIEFFNLRQFLDSSSKSFVNFDYCSLTTTASKTKSRSSSRLIPKSKFNIIAAALVYTALLLSEMCVHVEASIIDEAALKEVRFKKADVKVPIVNGSPNLSSTSDAADNSKPSVSNKDDIKANNLTENETKNNTSYSEATSIFSQMKDNKDMLMRTMYVTLGVTGIVVVYFIIRAVRLRRKRTKSRKYGIITQQGDHGDMEMEPLGAGDDEEEDYTVFEVNGHKK